VAPQRLIEMWRDVDSLRGYPSRAGRALSPFEYEVLKYSTGKSTIADIAESSTSGSESVRRTRRIDGANH
jgi:hypothetical protein